MLGVLFYDFLSYSLETGFLTQSKARLTASNPNNHLVTGGSRSGPRPGAV